MLMNKEAKLSEELRTQLTEELGAALAVISKSDEGNSGVVTIPRCIHTPLSRA
jgi:hypothetical protein